MKPEKRRQVFEQLLDLAQSSGDETHQDNAAAMVAQQNHFYGELDENEAGVRDSMQHRHHKTPDLRASLAQGWRIMRRLARQMEHPSNTK